MTFRHVLTREWKSASEQERDDLVLCKSTGEPFRTEERDMWIRGGVSAEGIEFLDGGELTFSNDDDKVAQIQGLLKNTPQTSIWTISTDQRDRMRDRIETSGWDTKGFKQNSVVLWAHQSREPPIGKVLQLWTDTKGQHKRLRAIKQFTDEERNPFGAMIWRLTEAGFLKAASVGFRRLKSIPDPDDEMGLIFKKQELLESSVVPIPANPFALQGAKGIDLSPYVPWAERLLDAPEGEEMFSLPRELVERVYIIVRGEPKSVSVLDPPTEKAKKAMAEMGIVTGATINGLLEPAQPDLLPATPAPTHEQIAKHLADVLVPALEKLDLSEPCASHCGACSKVVIDKDAIKHEGKMYCEGCEPDAVKLARLVAETEAAKRLALIEEAAKSAEATETAPPTFDELLECIDTLEFDDEPADEEFDLDALTPETLKQMVSAALTEATQ